MTGPTSLGSWESDVSTTQSPPLRVVVTLGAFLYEIEYYLYADENDGIVYIYQNGSYYG